MASKGRGFRTETIEGFEVLVGKGDADNDALTFRVAEPHDLGSTWPALRGAT